MDQQICLMVCVTDCPLYKSIKVNSLFCETPARPLGHWLPVRLPIRPTTHPDPNSITSSSWKQVVPRLVDVKISLARLDTTRHARQAVCECVEDCLCSTSLRELEIMNFSLISPELSVGLFSLTRPDPTHCQVNLWTQYPTQPNPTEPPYINNYRSAVRIMHQTAKRIRLSRLDTKIHDIQTNDRILPAENKHFGPRTDRSQTNPTPGSTQPTDNSV